MVWSTWSLSRLFQVFWLNRGPLWKPIDARFPLGANARLAVMQEHEESSQQRGGVECRSMPLVFVVAAMLGRGHTSAIHRSTLSCRNLQRPCPERFCDLSLKCHCFTILVVDTSFLGLQRRLWDPKITCAGNWGSGDHVGGRE